ncbi:alanine--tRNA ligase-related protein [Kribbella sp. NBC_01245]|uniref:alanine--tRNA ligase-related protein n=1 Tax=Kribbella sp. NBC_01245 TaxID=2903578 RepID=UPI002E2A69A1|nr:alanine--tRNA ligase-related protein [Kribbella sp. NBC_01245]
MESTKVLRTFEDFFSDRGHHRITGSTLLPEPGDPVLFTTSGMHPLTPYLDGTRRHPHRRLSNRQRCLRTTDLDEVGDTSHLTVFEMLGSWSLGDYTHEQSLRWGYDLLTNGFGLNRLHVTVFGGNHEVGPDLESERVWSELGLPVERLVDDNWWSNGPTGPCGPDSEIFVWTGNTEPEGTPSTDPRWVEVWNHVHMRFHRYDDGVLRPFTPSNVDTGMGFERLLMFLQGVDSVYETDQFGPWSQHVRRLWRPDETSFRILSDHLRSSIVVIGDGVRPSNTGRGYVLRRLVRRSLTTLRRLDPTHGLEELPIDLIQHTIDHFGQPDDPGRIRELLLDEERRFRQLLDRGRDRVLRLHERGPLTESDFTFLRETHGLPREVVESVLTESQ